ncbi:MAG: hypothetical protein H6Q07_2152 [Acidobacteria bacterium]|jgi:hypothetical protein|nr:hypothetical protein [Acidobacteriota bacterium]
MSWWKLEDDGNKKTVVTTFFSIRVFLILLAMGVLYLALMVAARLLEQ